MTGPEHYTEAERLISRAGTWENADTGWKAHMSGEERISQRMADLAEAQVHALLASAAATALPDDSSAEQAAWRQAAAVLQPS